MTVSACYTVPGVDVEVGMYTGRGPVRQSSLPCPYCQQEMEEAIGDGRYRVSAVVSCDGRNTLVHGHLIPTTHRLFGCKVCRQGFTMPHHPGAV